MPSKSRRKRAVLYGILGYGFHLLVVLGSSINDVSIYLLECEGALNIVEKFMVF